MDTWVVLPFITGGFLVSYRLNMSPNRVACNNGAGDSNTKTVKSQISLLIRKEKLKTFFRPFGGIHFRFTDLVSDDTDVFNLKFNNITGLNPAVEFPSTPFSHGAGT